MRPDRGAIEHLDDARGPAATRKCLKESLEGPALRQSPEPPPDRVPRPKLGGERAPGDVVHREIMQRFKKAPIVAPLATSP